MGNITYDSDSMKLIMLFESMTRAKVKDCIQDEKIVFVIEQGDMGKAIGKSGANIRRMETQLKKKIRLVEFSSDVLQFVRNVIHPIEALGITQDSGIITIHGKDTSARAMLIGRERKNINHITQIVKRYFDVKEIKVV